MKKLILIPLLFLILSGTFSLQAQQPEQEKLLITLDRTNYVPGDYVWFSGFNISGTNHTLLGNEYILHVCLYDPNGELSKHNLYFINRGTFKGHIELPKGAKKGLYRIVAYTNWMQNWGDNALYQKLIWVNGEKSSLNFTPSYNWIKTGKTDTLMVTLKMDKTNQTDFSFLNVTSKLQTAKGKPILENQLTSEETFHLAIPINESEVKDSLKLKLEVADETSAVTKQLLIRTNNQKPDVQFLPESGNLLTGYKQRIAFKAIADNGFPIKIKGKVYDQNNAEVAQINTIHDGMGSFYITPKSGDKYHAIIELNNGKTFKYNLPTAVKNGAIIQISQQPKSCTLKILGTPPSQPLTLKVHNKGVLITEQAIKTLPSKALQFNTSTYPEGIIHFTLTNSANLPLCERIIFNTPQANINVSFPIDKQDFVERDSILLPIEIENINTDQLALYSISVLDKHFHNDYIGGNAITELLLTSELSGFIGNPGYYLAQTDKAKQAADLLMLTHGWCRFNWADVATTNSTMVFEREGNVYLKGQLRHILTNKPLKKNYAQGLFYAPGQSIRKSAISDDNGDFIFEFPDIDFNLKTNLKFASKNGGNPRSVRATLESLTEITEIDMARTNVEVSSKNKAPLMPLVESAHLKLDKAPIANLAQYIPRKPREDNYFSIGMDTVVLNELEVSKKRLLNGRENMRALYGTPQKVVTSKQVLAMAEDISWYSSVWDLLSFLFPELDINSYLLRDGLDDDDPYKYEYIYGVKHIKDTSRPLFVMLNGRRVYAHENPKLFGDQIDIEIQLERFKTINPKLITSVELYDAKDNFNYVMDNYETNLISYTSNLDNQFNDYILANKPTTIPYILSITTTGGFGSWGNDDTKELAAEVRGFEALKTPYAPKYNVPESDSIIFDGRKTLYWNPIVVAKNGTAKSFNFYSGDTEGEKLIQVNGITSDGIPFFGQTSITVTNSNTDSENLTPDQTAKIDMVNRFVKASKKQITTNHVTLKCLNKSDKSVLANILLTTDNNHYLSTNSEGETIINKHLAANITVSGLGYKNQTIQLSQLKSDSVIIWLEPSMASNSTIIKSADKLVRSAITVSAKQMPKEQIRKSFFREKVYENDYLLSLDDWVITSKIFSYGLFRDEGELNFEKGKSYKTFDYREKIKATPNRRDTYFPYSADPMYVRKPFLDLQYMKYYNYSITGETKLNNRACVEVLFDVKPDQYMAGYRGKLIIDKTTHMVVCVTYFLSPTNRDFLDDSYFIHDNPGRFDIELQKATYFVRYNTEDDNYYPLITHEKIDFTINKLNKQTFIRETLFNGVVTENGFKPRAISDTNRKTYLVKSPMYDKAIFEDINMIKLPHNDFEAMPFLHEISRFN